MRKLLLLVLLMTVSGIVCKVYLGAPDYSELILNPGFETAGGGGADVFGSWSEWDIGAGEIHDEAVIVHGGGHAAELIYYGVGTDSVAVYQAFVPTPGDRYRLTFWTRGDGSGAQLRYGAYDYTHSLWIDATGFLVNSGVSGTTYTQITYNFVIPSGCISLGIFFYGSAMTSGGAGSVYLDDVSLINLSPASWVDKSSDVLRDIGVQWGRGMQGARITDLLAGTGICTFSLDNSASQVAGVTRLQGQYSPNHANCVAGFAIGCPVKVTLNVDGAGETTEFIGKISNIRPSSGIYQGEITEVEAHDWMGYLSSQQLGLQTLAVNQTIDDGITTALAGFPIQPEATSFGVGLETFLTLFDTEDSQTSMASFFSKLARCEFGRIYLTGAGTLTVENRHVRPLALTPAFTLDGTMSELDVSYNQGDISNVVIVRTYPARIDTVAVRLWDLARAGCPKIEPGEVFTMVCPYRDPAGGGKISATSVTNPVTVVEFGSKADYASNDLAAFLTQANEVGSNQMIAHLTNTSSKTGYLNDFQVYGLGIYHYAPIEMEVRDTFSIASGAGEQRDVFNLEQISNPQTGANYAALVKSIISRQHVEGVTVAFRANQTDVLAPLATAAEISQRFTLTEEQTGLSQDFFINKLEYEYRDNQLDVTILAVPASRSDCWIWDTSEWDNTVGQGWTL